MYKLNFRISILLIFIVGFSNIATAQDESVEKSSKKKGLSFAEFKDPVDNAFDISVFLDEPKGILPVPIIITEPAIGYGGGLFVLMLKPNKSKQNKRLPPNISGVMGFGTQNKTWGAGIFHFHSFKEDRIRYTGLLMKPTINIKYYGSEDTNPVKLKMDSWLVFQRVVFRLKESNFFIGPEYIYFHTKNTIDGLLSRPVLPSLQVLDGKSNISMLGLVFNYDSRNTIFTPDKGYETGVSVRYNATFLGGDDEYWMLNPYFMTWLPIGKKVFSGYRFDTQFALGDAPFYTKPYVSMRGVPAMRYQGEKTMVVETEWRGFVYHRWSLVGFVGTGKAFNKYSDFQDAKWIYSYGAGFRYELAKKYGLHAGTDFAWSNDDFGFYIVFGTYWRK